MIRSFLFPILLAAALAVGAYGQDQGGTPSLPLEQATESTKLTEVKDLWQRRIESLRAVSGSIEAQKTIVEALQRAFEKNGETIYLWHALYYQARVLHDRVQLSGDAIATLESLLHVLQQVPADKAGVLIERKLVEIEAQLKEQQQRYHRAKGAEREIAMQAYVELYAACKQFRDFRKDLEDGDASIRERTKLIEAEIQSLTDRIERDCFAKDLIQTRLPVLTVQDDIAHVRRALGEVQKAVEPLGKGIPGVLSLSDTVRAEALKALNTTNIPNNPETK